RAARIEESVPIAGELFEDGRVDVVSVGLDRVAISPRDDDVRARTAGSSGLEGATESRNVGAERLLRGSGRIVAPELLDELLDGHDETPARDQAGEDHALL